MPNKNTKEINERRNWMKILAYAQLDELEKSFLELPNPLNYDFLRKPESGLVMVRARTGGTGNRFNLGEVTITRCTINLNNKTIGHSYILGRNKRHAEIAAVFDALLQEGNQRDVLESLILTQREKQKKRSTKVTETKVDFFTLEQEDDL